jgi:hypothetical protein
MLTPFIKFMKSLPFAHHDLKVMGQPAVQDLLIWICGKNRVAGRVVGPLFSGPAIFI